MGLLLSPGAYYAETSEGAHVLSPVGEFAFAGGSVYRLLDRLAPFLNGRHTLAELTATLTPERQAMVRDLVTALVDRSLVADIEPPPELPEAPSAGSGGRMSASVLAEYRATTTLVLGTGELGAAVATAAARSGLRDVRVVAAPDDSLAVPEIDSAIKLVLHVADGSMVERARLLDRVCRDRGIRLVQALVVGDNVWLANRPGDSWSAGWRRARPFVGAGQLPSSKLNPLPAKVVATQLVHGVVRSITRPAEPGRSRMVRVDLSTLASEAATFLPHPFSAAVAPVTDILDRVEQLQQGDRLTDEEFSRRAAVCAGDLVGVFGSPVERDFVQQPLHVCAIEVPDPAGLLDRGEAAVTITGAGLTFATARLRAARKAFAVHGSLMVDPRRLVPAKPGGIDVRADPDDLLLAVRRGSVSGLVPGYGLVDGDRQLLDVHRVFPALRVAGMPYEPSAGVAAGYDWDEAVTAGLVGQSRSLTIRSMSASRRPFPRVDLAGAALDERGDRYRALLAATDLPVTVYNITGPLGVPTMVGYLGPVAAGCGSSLSGAVALTDTLEELLLHHQAGSNRQNAYAPSSVPGVPPALRGTEVVPIAAGSTATALLSKLVAYGHNPVAVPLDHDREVNAVMPYVVHVVMSR